MSQVTKMTLPNINICYTCLLAGIMTYSCASSEPVTTQAFTNPYQNITLEQRRQAIIFEIGKALCPYSDYCQRKKVLNYDFRLAPCCADCSCEDSCWETGNCCPDKEVIDKREPSQSCHESIVKKSKLSTDGNEISHGIWSYYIIDYCPETEQNASVIKKCNLTDIDHIEDYRWLSDNLSGNIYQNKFCAACHGRKNLTKWQLVTRCEAVLFANFSYMNSLLLSDKCDIINREPNESTDAIYKRCIIPFYTRCNQTGLWTNYDPDIVWACNIYTSIFTVIVNTHASFYKNAFCYACNLPRIENAATMCMGILDSSNKLSFRILIDYDRTEDLGKKHLTANSECEMNEIRDPYMQKCRRLMCPFAHVPVYGNCKQLVEKTHGLSMEAVYSISVVWSRVDFYWTEQILESMQMASEIFMEAKRRIVFDESGLSCPFCYQELRFLKEIFRSNGSQINSASDPGKEKPVKRINYTEPNFLFSSILYTEDNCQLSNLMQNALNLAGSEIEIITNGKTAMSLHVELLTENVNSLITASKVIYMDITGLHCPVTYKLRTLSICPKINISVIEFKHLFTEHNADIINSMFAAGNRDVNGFAEICVDDYFEKLSNVDFATIGNNGITYKHKHVFSYMKILEIGHLLRWAYLAADVA